MPPLVLIEKNISCILSFFPLFSILPSLTLAGQLRETLTLS